MSMNTAKAKGISGALLLGLLLAALPAWAAHFETEAPGRIDDYALDATAAQCETYGPCDDEGRLRLSSLPGRFLFIEVFSMYCPYCQAEAADINELARLVENSAYGDDISLVGLGAGNSRFEVDFFKDKYSIAFPLFPDPEMVCYTAVNQPGTPYFILAEKDGKEGLKVLWTHRGPFEDSPEKVLAHMLEHAGLME